MSWTLCRHSNLHPSWTLAGWTECSGWHRQPWTRHRSISHAHWPRDIHLNSRNEINIRKAIIPRFDQTFSEAILIRCTLCCNSCVGRADVGIQSCPMTPFVFARYHTTRHPQSNTTLFWKRVFFLCAPDADSFACRGSMPSCLIQSIILPDQVPQCQNN